MILFFPMGGTSTRFVEAGYPLPKPLLDLKGKHLIQFALESVSLLNGRYHFSPSLTLARHPLFMGLLPGGCWHVVMEPTAGPLQTMLEAEGCLQADEELLICDCDSFMDAKELLEAVEVFRGSEAMGGVTIRQTQDAHCSYAEVDREWWVTQTREKDPFTPWSTTGPYWFRSAKQFWMAAKRAAAAQQTSISPVYNYLPGRTKEMPVESFRHVGTPKEFEAYRASWT
jgi:NDP-sugar pyrophosphorylase family protein